MGGESSENPRRVENSQKIRVNFLFGMGGEIQRIFARAPTNINSEVCWTNSTSQEATKSDQMSTVRRSERLSLKKSISRPTPPAPRPTPQEIQAYCCIARAEQIENLRRGLDIEKDFSRRLNLANIRAHEEIDLQQAIVHRKNETIRELQAEIAFLKMRAERFESCNITLTGTVQILTKLLAEEEAKTDAERKTAESERKKVQNLAETCKFLNSHLWKLKEHLAEQFTDESSDEEIIDESGTDEDLPEINPFQ